jgi:hypothetical protein
VMPVTVLVVVRARLGANRGARGCADGRSNSRATPAADRRANAGTDRAPDNGAADRIRASRGWGAQQKNSNRNRRKHCFAHHCLPKSI